jgi:propanol-preferring alcohol dehydrogenase
MGAARVFAVDINPGRRKNAADAGAVPVDASSGDAAGQILAATGGRGVDAALELIGLKNTIEQAVECLAPKGRAAVAGISREYAEIDTYRQLVGKEAELMGVSDHLLSEVKELISLSDRLRFDHIITARIPLDEKPINDALMRIGNYGDGIRTVIEP